MKLILQCNRFRPKKQVIQTQTQGIFWRRNGRGDTWERSETRYPSPRRPFAWVGGGKESSSPVTAAPWSVSSYRFKPLPVPTASGVAEWIVMDSEVWSQFRWEKLQEARVPPSVAVWFKDTAVYISIYNVYELKGIKTTRKPKRKQLMHYSDRIQ